MTSAEEEAGARAYAVRLEQALPPTAPRVTDLRDGQVHRRDGTD